MQIERQRDTHGPIRYCTHRTQLTHCHSFTFTHYRHGRFMHFNQQHENRCTHTNTHKDTFSFSPPSLPHPVPLSLLVEQNDDQLGVHLVSVLAERQITPLKRHIHQVPVEGNVGEGDRGRDSLRHISRPEKYLCQRQLANVSFALYIHIIS